MCYVDDLLAFAKRSDDIVYMEAPLGKGKRVKVKDLDMRKQFSGIEMTWSQDESILISRPRLIPKLLEVTGEEVAKTVENPIGIFIPSFSDEERLLFNQGITTCRSIIGSFMFLAISTSRDLCVAASKMGSYGDSPTQAHRKAPRSPL